MPLYEYQCDACGHRFEMIQKFSDPPLERRARSAAAPVHKLMSSPAIQFKGSGFYITDYAEEGQRRGGEVRRRAERRQAEEGDKSEKAREGRTKAEKSDKGDKSDKAEKTTSRRDKSSETRASTSTDAERRQRLDAAGAADAGTKDS